MSRRGTLVQGYLAESARRLPDKAALVCGRRRATYRDLDDASDALARSLAARGVGRGERVVVFGENSIETVVAFWAVLKAGAVVSIINPLNKADKLAYCLNDLRAIALLAEAELAATFVPAVARSPHLRTVVVSGALADAQVAALPGCVTYTEALEHGRELQLTLPVPIDVDLAMIVYTSGSTGEPKGVMLTHRNILTATASITTYLENVEDDVILGAMPLAFDYGLYQMIMAFSLGARLVLERSFALLPQVIARVAKERVTGFPCLPTVCALLSEMKTLHEYNLSSVRYVTVSGAHLPQKHIRLLQRSFPGALIYSMFGLTECKRCSYLPPEDLERKPGSVGIAIPNTELWVVDEHGRRLGANEVGELVIRGATVMRGYWDDSELSALRLRPGPLPGELVLHTGDLCRLDDEGYLYFVARMDDVIKSRGEKVPPREVEAVLLALDGVKEAAVIGVPDEILGSAIKAFVALEDGVRLSATDIDTHCRSRLAPAMVPRHVEFLPSLPKTNTGKVDKGALS